MRVLSAIPAKLKQIFRLLRPIAPENNQNENNVVWLVSGRLLRQPISRIMSMIA